MLIVEHPSYGWFWGARVASAMAFQMQAVAVGWQVYELTHSAFQLGMVGLVQYVPIVLLTLVAGHVADRYDRRAVFGASIAVQGAASLVLAAGSHWHWLGVPGIFSIVAVVGAARSFQGPASQALTPTLVPENLVPKAVAWSSGGLSCVRTRPAISSCKN